MRKAEQYRTKEIDGVTYVLCRCNRTGGAVQANFEGTGLALAGQLNEGQTLAQWVKNINDTEPMRKISADLFHTASKSVAMKNYRKLQKW